MALSHLSLPQQFYDLNRHFSSLFKRHYPYSLTALIHCTVYINQSTSLF